MKSALMGVTKTYSTAQKSDTTLEHGRLRSEARVQLDFLLSLKDERLKYCLCDGEF